MNSAEAPVKSLYSTLEARRRSFLDRARDCSSLTIPSLVPPDGHQDTNRLATPFQSDGASGVTNLANKLLLALLPPNAAFFRLRIGEDVLRQLAEAGGKVKSEVEENLATIERQMQAEMEALAIRVQSFEALLHAIVAGNALCYVDTEGMRVFHLSQYVVERDPSGNVQTIITKECLSPASLPQQIKAAVMASQTEKGGYPPADSVTGTMQGREPTVEVYTQVKRESPNKFRIHQEVCGQIVPGSEGTYTTETMPYIPLRFNHVSGESYGRGHVETALGDLQSLEGLSQAIVEGAAAAAKVVFLFNPNGTTRMNKVAKAPNGGFAEGSEEDIGRLGLDKFHDFKVAADTAAVLRESLAFHFLKNSAVQRNGERVTAEEIRFMAGELEDTLGGVYSVLSQEFQLPLVRVLMAQLARQKKIPKLPKSVRPSIVTGLEALGRGHDLTRLQVALKTAADIFGPEAVLSLCNPSEALRRILTASGVEAKDLIKDEQQLAQEAQQQQMQSAVENLGPEVIRQVGAAAQTQAAQPAQ